VLVFSCVNNSFFKLLNLLESFDFNKDAVLADEEGCCNVCGKFEEDEAAPDDSDIKLLNFLLNILYNNR
jgi:hypothetical protein